MFRHLLYFEFKSTTANNNFNRRFFTLYLFQEKKENKINDGSVSLSPFQGAPICACWLTDQTE